MTGMAASALVADGATTMHALRKHPDLLHEDVLATRPFVSSGIWPGQIAGGGVVMPVTLGTP